MVEDALNFSRGKDSIAYRGGRPWESLVKSQLSPKGSLATWQKESRLDWEVKKAQAVFTPDGKDKPIEFPNRTVLYRTDTDGPLGVVSNSHFKPVQPVEALEFYVDLIRDYGYKLEWAGPMKGGQKIWAMANIGKPFVIGKSGKNSDTLGSYLLFATGMDGSTATTIRVMSVRDCCQNILGKQVGDKGLSISHRGKFDPVVAKEKLGILIKETDSFLRIGNELALKKFSDEQAKSFFEELIGASAEIIDQKKDNKKNNRYEDLMLAYKKGPGAELASAKGTAWGAVNAVTYYVDHIVGRAVDTRLNKAWFGANARLKTKALSLAMKAAKIAV